MESFSDVELKRSVDWLRLELLAWICLCADVLVAFWAPTVWDTGRMYSLFVLVVLVSGLAAVILCWLRNPLRRRMAGVQQKLFWGSHGVCLAASLAQFFWIPQLVLGLLFVWNSLYLLLAYERELRKRKHLTES